MKGLHSARAVLLAVWAGWAGQSVAGETFATIGHGAVPQPLSLSELDAARMPGGLASLCLRDPSFCAPIATSPQPLTFTAERLKLLREVNSAINHRIVSKTDEELYGKAEYWTMPSRAGDCEDYVLLKRRTLAALGIDPGLLLITVAHDENGQGHAVLTVPTTRGDLVLDNRRDEVLHWLATGYTFVKRQSAANPNMWVSLSHDKLQATNMASGPEAQLSD